jgi:hypothetical protein
MLARKKKEAGMMEFEERLKLPLTERRAVKQASIANVIALCKKVVARDTLTPDEDAELAALHRRAERHRAEGRMQTPGNEWYVLSIADNVLAEFLCDDDHLHPDYWSLLKQADRNDDAKRGA